MDLPEIQVIGRPTRLLTPVVKGGKTYSWGCLFVPGPSNRNEGTELVTGTVHSATLDGDVWTIICNRGMQYSSVTKRLEGMGPTEVEYPVSTGGNICNSRVWMRVRSFNNPMAQVGSLAAVRVVPGDGLMFVQAEKEILVEVTYAVAYDAAQEAVDYREELPTTRTQRIAGGMNDVAVNFSTTDGSGFDEFVEGGKVRFETGEAAPWDGSYCLIYDGATYTAATRYVHLNGTTGAEEPTVLPGDWAPAGAVYWWDGASKGWRLGSGCGDYGTQALVGYYLTGCTIARGINHDARVLIEATADHAGVSDAGDAYPSSSWQVSNDYDVWWVVSQESIVHWRTSTAAGAPGVFAVVTAGGAITARMRNETDGVTTVLGTASLTLPCQVRLEKSGAAVNVYARQTGGDSWALVGTGYPSELDATASGILGLGRALTGASGYTLGGVTTVDRTLMLVGDSAGDQHVHRFRTVDFVTEQAYPPGHSTTIVSVTNVTAGVTMTPSGTPGRDHYTVDAGNIVLTSETDGDEVRILWAAAETVGEGPGWGPRNFNQPHFCQVVEDEDGNPVASTTIAENVANARDMVKVHREGTGLVVSPGDEFVGYRGRGVWSAEHDVAIYWADRMGPDATWVPIASDDFLLRKYQGLLLLEDGFRETLPEWFCLMGVGRRFVAQAVDETLLNEPVAAMQITDELHVKALTPTGAGGGIGVTVRMPIGVPNWSVRTVPGGKKAWAPTGWEACGPLYVDWGPLGGTHYSDAAGAWSYNLDAHLSNYGWTKATLDTNTHAQTYDCIADGDWAGGDYRKCFDNWSVQQARQVFYEVTPFDATSGTGYAGCTYWAGSTTSGAGHTEVSADASFQRLPVSLTGLMKRLRSGGVVVSGKMEVKIHGLKVQSWVSEGAVRTALVGGVQGTKSKLWVNGALQLDFCDDATLGTVVNDTFTVPQTVTSGPVAFSLVATRRDSRNVVLNEGTVVEAPTERIISTGGIGGVSTATADEWCVVDVTSMLRGLEALLDSLAGYDLFFMFPGGGAPSPVSSAESLEGYGLGLLPEVSTTFVDNIESAGEYIAGSTQTGYWFGFEGWEIRDVLARVQMPDGSIEDCAVGMVTPRSV